MNKDFFQDNLLHKENLEKVFLIIVNYISFVILAFLTMFSYFVKGELFQTIFTAFCIMTVLSLTAMVIRKGMKYKIGKEGIEIGYETKESVPVQPMETEQFKGV